MSGNISQRKTILITGSSDGIGRETAGMLLARGHRVLLHGRNAAKLKAVEAALSRMPGGGQVESYLADLSRLSEVAALARAVTERHSQLDVLINNAGVFRSPASITAGGLDVRFAVNTLAPVLLARRLLPLIGRDGRVINVSSAAQSPVDEAALRGQRRLSDDYAAYAQSKLALTMWSHRIGLALRDEGPVVVALNPGSLLGTKMVTEAFGVAGGDIRKGADILIRAALSDEFKSAAGAYFDNDSGRFAPPHADALDPTKSDAVVRAIESILAEWID